MANLPTKERAGKLESLDLAVDQGLAELCHLVIYEDGYVAAEFNFDGPRVTRLGEYLYAKRQKLTTKPKFLPLFQSDVLSLVRGMPVVNLLELKGVPRAASLLAKADQHLGQAYATIGDVGANKSIQLVMAGENYPESRLKNLAVRLAGLSRHLDRDVRYDMTKLSVRGFTADGRIDEVDLLEDHLIAVKTFERQDAKGKAISSNSAYEQIDAAFYERRSKLEGAIEGRNFR